MAWLGLEPATCLLASENIVLSTPHVEILHYTNKTLRVSRFGHAMAILLHDFLLKLTMLSLKANYWFLHLY